MPKLETAKTVGSKVMHAFKKNEKLQLYMEEERDSGITISDYLKLQRQCAKAAN